MNSSPTVTDTNAEATNVKLDLTDDYGEGEIDGQKQKIDENYLKAPEVRQMVADCKTRAKQGFKENMELFELLDKVKRAKAYLAEPGPDGKPLYNTFEAFLANCVGITRAILSEMRKAHDGWTWANTTLAPQDLERITKNSFFYTQLGRIPANRRLEAVRELLAAKERLNGCDLVRWRTTNNLVDTADRRDIEAMADAACCTPPSDDLEGDEPLSEEQEAEALLASTDARRNASLGSDEVEADQDELESEDNEDNDDSVAAFIINDEDTAREYVDLIVSLLTSDSLAYFVAAENGDLEDGEKSMVQKLNDAMEVFQQNLAATTGNVSLNEKK